MRGINTYKAAIRTIRKYSPRKIKLRVKEREFDGVYCFPPPGIHSHDGPVLFIKRDLSDHRILDDDFVGKYSDLYPGCYGREFAIMLISEKFQRKYTSWTKEEWIEYKNQGNNPEFVIELI